MKGKSFLIFFFLFQASYVAEEGRRVAKRAKKGTGVTRKRLDKHLEREHPSIYSWEPQSARLESLFDYCIRLRLRSVKQKCRLGENSAPTVCLHATRPRGFTLYSLGCISVKCGAWIQSSIRDPEDRRFLRRFFSAGLVCEIRFFRGIHVSWIIKIVSLK